MLVQSINPYNQSIVGEYQLLTDGQINAALNNAATAFMHWRKVSFADRSGAFAKLAKLLRSQRQALAELITLEMGKVLAESLAEIDKCAGQCDYYAENGPAYLQPTIISSEAQKSYVLYQPVGCILGVMPWNFPFWQVFRYAVPVLMSGNVTVLKHASNVLGCALKIESLFKEAGFPNGVFQTLTISAKQTEIIVANNIVQGVSLTGSEFAGASVASIAGKHIKKTVMELGGSDPFIVLEDADLKVAAKAALQSRMSNAGQVCIAAKRFIVAKKIEDQFIATFLELARSLKQGNGMEAGITTGPLAKEDLAKDLHLQLSNSLQMGAQLQMGGEYQGNNYQPTVVTNITSEMPVFAEETFGPLAAIIAAENDAEAIRLANNSQFGLGASVWTSDLERGANLAAQIESGSVFVNAIVRSDYRFPMGGIKKSGYGRELAEIGIKEFTNVKTVYINP